MFVNFFLLLLLIGPSFQSEEYHEELFVKPLPNGHVNTYFQFTNRWKLGSENNLHHTHLFPLSISDILLKFNIKELHVSLTQGLWHYESWGYPVVDAAPGAEVWAWFAGKNLTTESVDSQWKNLANVLSGLLCASFNFVDKTNTVEPKYSFLPKFSFSNIKTNDKKFIRYAALPRESVCTENLTPWKKLLPCNSNFGFASLLNSGFVHNTNYHSLGLSIRTLCDDYTEGCVIEFTQTANLIYNTKLLGSSDFSLRRMFGQGLNGACALSTSSKIYIDITNDNYHVTPLPDNEIISIRGGSETIFGEYDIKKQLPNQLFNIAWVKKNTNLVDIPPSPMVTAHRFLLGYGQERGQIVTSIKNSHWSDLNVVLMENIAWFVPSYIHTLKIKNLNGTEIKPKAIHYIPGRQRERPYHLEIAFTLPAKSTVEVLFDFDYIFLKWLEYPPDANHGHYLGPAVLSTLLPLAKSYTAIPLDGYLFKDSFNASRSTYFLQIRTEILILTLPTPDFSMPYNVICLACTVVALAFGPIHSVATKKIVIENSKEKSNKTFLTKLKLAIKKLFSKKQNELNLNEKIEVIPDDRTTGIGDSNEESLK